MNNIITFAYNNTNVRTVTAEDNSLTSQEFSAHNTQGRGDTNHGVAPSFLS